MPNDRTQHARLRWPESNAGIDRNTRYLTDKRVDVGSDETVAERSADPLSRTGWTVRVQDSALVIVLVEDWIVRQTGVTANVAKNLFQNATARTLKFDASSLGHWDSALIVFLWDLQAEAGRLEIEFDPSGLPEPARRLLALASVQVAPTVTPAVREHPVQAMKVQSGRPVLQLRPVSVPDYLDTREILRRDRQNEVTASSTGLWAERLSVGVTHALAASLTTDLPGVVIVTGQPEAPPSRQIVVDVLEFEIGDHERCLLTARWTSLSGDGGKVLRRESDSFVEQAAPPGDMGVAAAMTRAIDRLALRIVATSRSPEFANAGGDTTRARGRPGI
jgi:uncharacterized protein